MARYRVRINMDSLKAGWIKNRIAQIKFDQLNSQNVSEFTQAEVEYTAADISKSYGVDFGDKDYPTVFQVYHNLKDNANIIQPTDCSH